MKKLVLIFAVLAFTLVQHCAFSQVTINGGVYEQDAITPIKEGIVTFSGINPEGDTLVFQFVTDSLGSYCDTLAVGTYQVWAWAEGYEPEYLEDSLQVFVGQIFTSVDFFLHEVFYPVRYVAARQFTNDLVRIGWSMHDPLLFENFETGDFSRFDWDNTHSDYPWVIDTLHAYEGTCCMKSACDSICNGVSEIEVSVYVPLTGEMSFYSKISSESAWDEGNFYLDGVNKMKCSGEEDWTEHRYDITVGEHTFRWTYVKDGTGDVGDDCFYVDNICFYQCDSVKNELGDEKSLQYFDLFRSRFDEVPVLMASHLTDTIFMEMNWNSLSWGKYRWGISCYYEGNRTLSDTIWSAFLDKEMTTTFQMNVMTNVGLSAQGAQVVLHSENNDYHGIVNNNGHLTLPNVYRDDYFVSVYLDGYVDYVSDSLISVMEPTQIEVELREEINVVDSLYVSSTGWAMWSLGETQNRGLQYYEIMLDSVIVGMTKNDFYQLDVSQLNEGDTCLVQVRSVYLSDTCEWRSCQWVYRSCFGFVGSPMGLNWSLHDENVMLSWDYPEGEALLGAVLFRDGEYLGFIEGNTFLDMTVELHGDVEYCLRLVYGGDFDGAYYSMSCEECIVAFLADCDPPANLDAVIYNENEADYGALISWGERPEPVNKWLYYDDGTFKRSLGGDDEPRIFWAIRFEAEDLAEYIGTSLKRVSLYDVAVGTYQLWIYVGGDQAPRTLVRAQNMVLSGSQTWHVESIVPAFEIPENEPLWIVVGQQGIARPAAACQDMENANGRWVSLDGETWTDMHAFNMHYTWMLRAFVSNQSGRSVEIGRDGYVLMHYNLYRSYDNTDYQHIAAIPAVDGQPYYEYRDNLADDPNEYFYYRLTAMYLSDEGETCESDYATTLENPSLQYVLIDLWSTDEMSSKALKLYPNPTSGQITIALEGMRKVEVYNTLGQALLNNEANGDVMQFDLSGFENGLYWVKVMAQDWTVVRSFVISR